MSLTTLKSSAFRSKPFGVSLGATRSSRGNHHVPGRKVDHEAADIDYMNQYRNFDNDGVRFSYDEGERFLSRLHAKKQHYVPIVDSAIYVPNPENASDAYPTYDSGVAEDAFMLNPDGKFKAAGFLRLGSAS